MVLAFIDLAKDFMSTNKKHMTTGLQFENKVKVGRVEFYNLAKLSPIWITRTPFSKIQVFSWIKSYGVSSNNLKSEIVFFWEYFKHSHLVSDSGNMEFFSSLKTSFSILFALNFIYLFLLLLFLQFYKGYKQGIYSSFAPYII